MPSISVIVPVYNGEATLRKCLTAITSSHRAPDQLIVVDDGSTDSSTQVIQSFNALLVTSEDGPVGPAAARNQGSQIASGADILVFIDADVVVHPDAIARMEDEVMSDPAVAAVFGSYDNKPPEKDIFSLYKNLLHHHTHQLGRQNASTFWAGCGAVRREVFQHLGGFDERYDRPSIEDIEFGTRVRAAGYEIRLCVDVLCTHLKRWTFYSLVHTDIFSRALPWSRLLVKQPCLLNDLNLSRSQRIAALGAVGLTVSPFISILTSSASIVVGVVSAILFVIPNLSLFRLFDRVGGTRLLIGGGALHWLYYHYASCAFLWAKLQHVLSRRRDETATS